MNSIPTIHSIEMHAFEQDVINIFNPSEFIGDARADLELARQLRYKILELYQIDYLEHGGEERLQRANQAREEYRYHEQLWGGLRQKHQEIESLKARIERYEAMSEAELLEEALRSCEASDEEAAIEEDEAADATPEREAVTENLPDLTGSWVCRQSCPAGGEGKVATIDQRGSHAVITNEGGDESTARLEGTDTIVAEQWGRRPERSYRGGRPQNPMGQRDDMGANVGLGPIGQQSSCNGSIGHLGLTLP